MDPQELSTYARDAASRGDDLFALLSVDATSSEAEIRRGFRRKALTAHPDKAGDAYDPVFYERLERARDVLINADSRKAYDDGMRAILQKKAQLDQMSSRRRKLVEELHRREEEAKRAKTGTAVETNHKANAELEAMAARGRAKKAERDRLMREAEERERITLAAEAPPKSRGSSKIHTTTEPPPVPTTDAPPKTTAEGGGDDYDARIADLERRIQEKQQRKAENKAKKSGAAATPSPGGTSTSTRDIPTNPSTADSKADADKIPSTGPAAAAPAAAPKDYTNFAPTMARLRAAQAKRDEEKKRRAQEEKEQEQEQARVPAP
ncbi:hypothetical protein B0T22DRAFT_471754 [Podospora appendiculata]|uniref:J domain-containing protein n=1 Tax=Podospora appendiculata TaxID=314037 RepID=A0AAE1C8E1_9PEZI|nr:hypothetical protein B0T22DRAFT_471754 [Podospora appendiculata]